MSYIQDVATIAGQGQVQLNVIVEPVMSPRVGALPVLETTLSIPSSIQVDAFCNALSLGNVVTFHLQLSGQQDLYYIGKNGNYYQFHSHP